MNHVPFVLPPAVGSVSNMRSRPSIVLSASVPEVRDPAAFEPADRQRVAEINRDYAQDARPERIRAAVAALTRVALNRGVRLVFGAHPTISPMMLQAARDMKADEESILVFQSDAYRPILPQSTLSLANWSRGRLILIQALPEAPFVPTPGPQALRRLDPFPNSLRFMRELMISVPGVLGAVFIGGMNGVEDEADLFAQRHPSLPRYALGSTGSAAARLLQRYPARFHGNLPDPVAFHAMPSYTVAASMILDELVPPAAGHP